MKSKIVLFYSSVKNKESFSTQLFYKIDIDILSSLGYKVKVTNSILDFFAFWKYDLAFIYFYRYGLFPAIISRFYMKKVYFTGGIDDLERSITKTKRYFLQVFFFKLCYFFSTKCFIVSTADLNNVKRIYNGKILGKLELSFHAIEVKKYMHGSAREKQNNFTTIAWMGSEHNIIRKGIDKSIFLFHKLTTDYKQFENSKFFIIGANGEGSMRLRKLVKKLDIENKIIFTGSIEEDEKIKLLASNRFYFQMSTYEGFGIAAVEALVSGNIVLHSGKGGLIDGIANHGILLDIRMPVDILARNAVELIDKASQEEFLSAGVQYIADNFSIEQRKYSFEKKM